MFNSGLKKSNPEPGPLVCSQCGEHESSPFDEGDGCQCGGTFKSVQYGWLCSVDNDRFEPMDYGEMYAEGSYEPMQTSLLRRGCRMAAFATKEDAEEALKDSGRKMKESGSDAFQRAIFCLVRVIARNRR